MKNLKKKRKHRGLRSFGDLGLVLVEVFPVMFSVMGVMLHMLPFGELNIAEDLRHLLADSGMHTGFVLLSDSLSVLLGHFAESLFVNLEHLVVLLIIEAEFLAAHLGFV